MSRLTDHEWDDYNEPGCQDCSAYAYDCCRVDNAISYCHRRLIYNRLAAYEDTGLEPEEIRALRAQQENKPLTLDELRQMDGEPVWVMHQDGSGARWGIVKDTEYGLCAVVDDDTAYWFTDVCGTIAYRSKPKEEEP